MNLILPEQYDPRLTIRETQEAIKYIRDTFQKEMGRQMNLERISAPLFVPQSSGLNDNLSSTLPGQVEAPGLKRVRLSAGRGALHQHERHPPG